MKIINESFELSQSYPLNKLGQLETILFFDIETTGFSGSYANVYLIGCVYHTNNHWQLIQWFADTIDSEVQILTEFFNFSKGFKTLLHFNGDRFDIPFLLKRCEHHRLNHNFAHLHSIDIYKMIKPYRNWLNLTSLKQKAIEVFLGINRQDLYSGGELIQVYRQYLWNHDTSLYDLLILHNADDLKGMTAILPILHYPDFFQQEFQLQKQILITQTDLFGDPHQQLQLTCSGPVSLPDQWEKTKFPILCSVKASQLQITVDLFEGTLKHFYPNYRDYVYLPYEDMAVHKSIGEYVEKTARKKATAQTCYLKKQGLFLPQYQPIWEPVFHKNYKDTISYTQYHDDLFTNTAQINTYIQQLFTFLNH